MPLPIVHSPRYDAELPADHRFPMGKFRRLAERLMDEGLVPNGFHVPAPAPAEWIALAHRREYVDQVLAAAVPDPIAREIGFPMTPTVALRARTASAGTVMTARLALEHGLACNTAGGSHHARRGQGAGFCVFNDVAVAIRVLQADHLIERALVIDLDVHQGDGTADIFTGDPTVFTLSAHAQKNYPVRKIPSSIDLGLADELEDAAYLDAVRPAIERAVTTFRPDMVFYNAGVDPHVEDRLGRLSLTDDGLRARDAFVIGLARSLDLPIACVIGGGYGDDIDRLVDRHAILHRTAALFVDR